MANKAKAAIDRIERECIALRVRMLNRMVTNVYDEALRPLRLKTSQLNVLVAVAKLGVAQPTRLCEILQLDVSTLSRNLDRMRTKGWIEVVPGEDNRAQPVRLAAPGWKLLDKAVPAWEEAQQQVSSLLGQEGVTLLTRTSRKMATQTSR